MSGSSCLGGSVYDAANKVVRTGLPQEFQYSYKAAWSTGNNFYKYSQYGYPVCTTRDVVSLPNKTKVSLYTNLTEELLRSRIAESPVVAAIAVDSAFLNLAGTLAWKCSYSVTQYNQLNHAIVVVGYDAAGNYIIKNSWGPGWGNNGFAKIDPKQNCGIRLYVVQFTSETSNTIQGNLNTAEGTFAS